MKNYILMLFASLCMLLAVNMDLAPINIGEHDSMIVYYDVGDYADIFFAVSYDFQTHGLQGQTNYVAKTHSIPVDELIPKPGWQTNGANGLYNKKIKRIIPAKISV